MAEYWTDDTREAIALYCSMEPGPSRDRLFNARIHGPLGKVAECLWAMHKFTLAHGDSARDVKADCVAHLAMSLAKFDPTRGTNSFSYFTRIARNFFFQYSNARRNSQKKHASVSLDCPQDVQFIGKVAADRFVVQLDAEGMMLEDESESFLYETLADIAANDGVADSVRQTAAVAMAAMSPELAVRTGVSESLVRSTRCNARRELAALVRSVAVRREAPCLLSGSR